MGRWTSGGGPRAGKAALGNLRAWQPGNAPGHTRTWERARQSLVWDRASNLIELFDGRPGHEWPDGFRPASYRASHDALYRVAGVELDYTHDSGARSPVDTFVDYRAELSEVEAADPMQTRPAPLLPAPAEGRVASLTYEYDWLANMVESTDDAYQFYERSLGVITHGFDEQHGRPSALRLASDLERRAPTHAFSPPGGRGGYVAVDYGEGGNVEMLSVHAQCTDLSFTSGAVCYDPDQSVGERIEYLRDNCVCAQEQHYQYRYDELNRLAEARRYDRVSGSGPWQLAARQRYRYDSGNARTVKQTVDVSGGGDAERIALYVFGGDFERRGMVRGGASLDEYVAASTGRQEDQYLVAGARMVWTAPLDGDVAELQADHRVTVALSDLLGTSGAVVDLASGEVVEASVYYPSGGRESFRGSDDGVIGAEPVGFTGKEGDEEVGVTYFGERYLIPRLGRWATPDPLSVHALGGGEFGNAFHYVSGNLLQARDPWGLSPDQFASEVNTAPEGVEPGDTFAQVPNADGGYKTFENLADLQKWADDNGARIYKFNPDAPHSLEQIEGLKDALDAIKRMPTPSDGPYTSGGIGQHAKVNPLSPDNDLNPGPEESVGGYRGQDGPGGKNEGLISGSGGGARRIEDVSRNPAEAAQAVVDPFSGPSGLGTLWGTLLAIGATIQKALRSGPSSPQRMQREVERGQAPREVKRVDRPHVPGQEPHVHFCNGTSCNQSGTTHDAHKGIPSPSSAAREWLESHGWTPPSKDKR